MTITEETRFESYIQRPIRSSEILGILGDREMTARQILQESKYDDMNCIRPRLTELKAQGKIAAVGKALDLATGRKVAIFKAI